MQTNFSPEQLRDPTIYDANEILRNCVHCGFCIATCPTYLLSGDELDGPRGRIYLIKEMLERNQPASITDVKHIDRCLSCFSCMTTCPSGVNYKNLSSFLSIADAFIVTLDSDASTFSVPSKIYAYLTIGRPILGSMPLENLGSKKIKRMKVGYVSKPENINNFMNHCKKIIKNKKLRTMFSENSKNYLKTRKSSIDQMINNIEQFKKR